MTFWMVDENKAEIVKKEAGWKEEETLMRMV